MFGVAVGADIGAWDWHSRLAGDLGSVLESSDFLMFILMFRCFCHGSPWPCKSRKYPQTAGKLPPATHLRLCSGLKKLYGNLK